MGGRHGLQPGAQHMTWGNSGSRSALLGLLWNVSQPLRSRTMTVLAVEISNIYKPFHADETCS